MMGKYVLLKNLLELPIFSWGAIKFLQCYQAKIEFAALFYNIYSLFNSSRLLKEPCSLGVCDHLFCKCCILNHLGNNCPECGSPAWVKDLLPNRELTVVVQMYQRLQRLVKQQPTSVNEITNTENAEDDLFQDTDDPISDDVTKTSSEDEKSKDFQTYPSIIDQSTEVKEKEDDRSTACDISRSPYVDKCQVIISESVSSSNTQDNNSEVQQKTDKRTTAKYSLPWRKNSSKKKTTKLQTKRLRCPRDTALLKENLDVLKKQMEISSFFSTSDDYCPPFKKHPMSAELRKRKLDSSNAEWGMMPLKDLTKNNDGGSKRKSIRRVSFRCLENELNLINALDQVSDIDENMKDAGRPVSKASMMANSEMCVDSVTHDMTEKTSQMPEDSVSLNTNKTRLRTRSSTSSSENKPKRNKKLVDIQRLPGATEYCNSSLKMANESPGTSKARQGNRCLERPIESIDSGKTRQGDCLTKSTPISEKRDASKRKRSSMEGGQSLVLSRRRSHCPRVAPVDQLMKRNKKGETPLHIAVIKGDIQEVETLLTQGADPNVRDYAGWRPLHEAANHGHATVVSLLLDHGALIDAPGFENDSPLHDALTNNRLDVVRILVKHGANLLARNMFGLTPSDMARTKAMKLALKTKVLPLEERTGHVVKPISPSKNDAYVFICTGLNNEQKKLVETCAKMLDADIVKDFTDDITHVIASCTAGVCLRTFKYLQGVISAKWVISFQWVESCLREQRAVDEESFEVAGTMSSPSSPGPKMARLNAAKQYPLLFDGCHFYFNGNFTTPSKKDLGQLVKSGGGTFLLREPKIDDDVIQSCRQVPYHASTDSPQPNCCYYIINSPLQDALSVHTAKLCSMPLSWLMDCIAQFKIISTEGY
ncbi:BRCA1-associated RING domain protein 1-like [Anneissia japonica]|uniref:BRCA1-associated RING domain protein 1-like n=1 Tax=Anneissia japonica TaxID=1529436 RepID=UPI001425BB27|nr:BRCA1-associated RING domain protein 1-like [Anneissia japonica]